MDPISPVVDGQTEIIVRGHGCRDLPALALLDAGVGGLMIVTRWAPTAADLARLNAGGSVFLFQFTDGAELQPVALETEPPEVEQLEITDHGIRSSGRPPGVILEPATADDRAIWDTASWINAHHMHGAPYWRVVGVNLDVRLVCRCGDSRMTTAPDLDTLAPAWKTSWRPL